MGARARIFLSSRFTEFQALRGTLGRRLQQAGYEVIDLNDGRAVPLSAVGRSIEEVQSADGVVLLNGQTYADSDDPAFVSPTHEEWRSAVAAEVPVFAYATAPEDRDPRVTRMLDELQEVTVIGALRGDLHALEDDAERIVNDLDAWASVSDEDTDSGQRRSLYDQISSELNAMGVAAAVSTPTASRGLSGEISERTTFALRALKAGDRAEARRQVEAAHTVYQYNWLTNFVHARLLEARGWNNDLALAHVAATRSLQTVADEPGRDEHADRRLVILHNLAARLARRRNDPAAALRSSRAALERDPLSGDALAEAARASSALDHRQDAIEFSGRLLKLYPTRAISLMRDPLLAPAQPDVERALIARVLDRLRQSGGKTGEGVSPTRLRDALALYREHVAVLRKGLLDEVHWIAEGVVVGPNGGPGRVVRIEQLAERAKGLSRLVEQLSDDASDLSADRMEGMDAGTRGAIDRVGELRAQVEASTRFSRGVKAALAWGAGAIALLIAAFFASPVLISITGSGLFTITLVLAAVWMFGSARDGSFSWLVAAVAGYVVARLIRYLVTGIPLWLFLVPGVLAGVYSLWVLVGAFRDKRSHASRQEELAEATRRAMVLLQTETAELRSQTAREEDACAAWKRRLGDITHRAGVPDTSPDLVVGLITHLADECRALNKALSVYPNWGFGTEYVPRRRAHPGDLTRTDADAFRDRGGLLQGSGTKRMVRLVNDSAVSDLASLGQDVATLAGLEDAFIRILAARQRVTELADATV